MSDEEINHPQHYTSSAAPLESELKDLRKARWYLDRKIARLERLAGKGEGDG